MNKSVLFLFSFLFFSVTFSYAQPNRVWATYYGQSSLGIGTKVTSSAYDPSSGYLYIAGTTSDSVGIATPGSFRSEFHPHLINGSANWETDIFIAKFDTLGNRIWATYYGSDSSADDTPTIVVDGNGFIYLAGHTQSKSGIATPGSYQPVSFGQYQAFLAKFNSAGQRIWGTYTTPPVLNFNDIHSYNPGLAVDRLNNVYISYATTEANGMATPGAHQTTFNANGIYTLPDAFLMKFSPDGVKLWGTYYGGTEWDELNSLYTDEENNIYGFGFTESTTGIASPGANVPTLTYQQDYTAFLVKFNSAGQRLWGTYIGGNTGSFPNRLIINGKDVYITGYTNSTSGIATPNSHQPIFGGGYCDLFLMKYNAGGNKVWGTYYGGGGDEGASFPAQYSTLAFDHNNNLFLVGTTNSLGGIKKGCGYTVSYKEGFLSKWDKEGNLIWGSYYDAPLYSVAAAAKGKGIYVGGSSVHDGLATPAAQQTTKVVNKASGIIARFNDEYICPADTITITAVNNGLSVDTGYASYQWYHNGILIPNADSFRYAPGQLDTGNYFVKVTNDCACQYTSGTFHVAAGTGIDNRNNAAQQLSLYPNPVKSTFTLKGILQQATQSISYTISDLSGREIQKGILESRSRIFQQQLDVSRLENGIYFIRLQSTEGSSGLKFIKH